MRRKIKVGLVSDGKYGTRAYENIRKVFEVTWILVPDIPTNVMLDDDLDLDIPDCDLYISYVRHPDVILQLAELKKPLILGVLPGNGLYDQAKKINSEVIHARTMCSLENNTGIEEIDEFTKYFGNPIYEIELSNDFKVDSIEVKRTSLCGSSEAGAKFLLNKPFSQENLQNFALSICYECRAPRFGRTCDKEAAGLIHLISLLKGISPDVKSQFDDNLNAYFEEVKSEYLRRANN